MWGGVAKHPTNLITSKPKPPPLLPFQNFEPRLLISFFIVANQRVVSLLVIFHSTKLLSTHL
jgi:hypothetical protein